MMGNSYLSGYSDFCLFHSGNVYSYEFEMEFKLSFEVLYYCFAALSAGYPILHTTELCKMASLPCKIKPFTAVPALLGAVCSMPSSLFPQGCNLAKAY